MASTDDAMELATDFEKQDDTVEDIEIELGEGDPSYAPEDANMFDDELDPPERNGRDGRFDEDDEMEDQEQGQEIADDEIIDADESIDGDNLLGDAAEGALQELDAPVVEASEIQDSTKSNEDVALEIAPDPFSHQEEHIAEEPESSIVKTDPGFTIGTVPSPKEGEKSEDLSFALDNNDRNDLFGEDLRPVAHSENGPLNESFKNDGTGVSQMNHTSEQIDKAEEFAEDNLFDDFDDEEEVKNSADRVDEYLTEQEESKNLTAPASNPSVQIGPSDEQSHNNIAEAHGSGPSSPNPEDLPNPDQEGESTPASHEVTEGRLQEEEVGARSNPLHPIVVHYQENEMSLFPPRHGDEHSETYFLHDEALADNSICDVLKACRLVLADSIEEGEELVMSVSCLNLEVSEFSEEAHSASLSQLTDIYLQLHENSQAKDPKPVHLTLNCRTRFKWQLGVLMSAVEQGKGVEVIDGYHHGDKGVSGRVFKDNEEFDFDDFHDNADLQDPTFFEEATEQIESNGKGSTDERFPRLETPNPSGVENDDFDVDFSTPLKPRGASALQSADFEFAADDGAHANNFTADFESDLDTPAENQRSSDTHITRTGIPTKNADSPRLEDQSTQFDEQFNSAGLTNEDEQHFDIASQRSLDNASKPGTNELTKLDDQASQFENNFGEASESGEFFEGQIKAATENVFPSPLPLNHHDDLADLDDFASTNINRNDHSQVTIPDGLADDDVDDPNGDTYHDGVERDTETNLGDLDVPQENGTASNLSIPDELESHQDLDQLRDTRAPNQDQIDNEYGLEFFDDEFAETYTKTEQTNEKAQLADEKVSESLVPASSGSLKRVRHSEDEAENESITTGGIEQRDSKRTRPE